MQRSQQCTVTSSSLALFLFTLFPQVASADIFQWEWVNPGDHSLGRQQSATLAPDGAGRNAVPLASLDSIDLTMAWMHATNLRLADFSDTLLTDADLSGANLAQAIFRETRLAGADLSGAIVLGTSFRHTVAYGFTASQLYSTASYQAANLSGIKLTVNDLTAWDFSGIILVDAHLNSATLTDADFSQANLTGAYFDNSGLVNADFSQANLLDAHLPDTHLTNANFNGAEIRGADFNSTTDSGFTSAQLYSTASYQAGNLEGIRLGSNDLTGWIFTSQNLADADFRRATLDSVDLSQANLMSADLRVASLVSADLSQANLIDANFEDAILNDADLSGANLTDANFRDTTLTNADLTGANLTNTVFRGSTLTNAILADTDIYGADFFSTTDSGFTAAQLYSTASYQGGSLISIRLAENDLTGWNFVGQALTDTNLIGSTLAGADFTGADVRGAFFDSTDLSTAQLYSTASYAAGDLSGIAIGKNDLTGWSFAGQNLTAARLSQATLVGADFSGALVNETNFAITTFNGFTAAQLYSTASYLAGDLKGIILGSNDLTGWSFVGQNLANSEFQHATLVGADFSGANLTSSNFSSSTLTGADFTGADTRGADWTTFVVGTPTTHNTIFSDGIIHGLNILSAETMRLWDYDPVAPLLIEVQDDLFIDPNGALRVVIEDDVWGSTITFEPGISVQLDGTLELFLDLDEGSTLASLIGTTFDLFDWTGVTPAGQFGQILTEDGTTWDTADLYTTGEVTLIAVVPIPEPSSLLLGALATAGLLMRRKR